MLSRSIFESNSGEGGLGGVVDVVLETITSGRVVLNAEEEVAAVEVVLGGESPTDICTSLDSKSKSTIGF